WLPRGLATNRCEQRSEEVPGFYIRTAWMVVTVFCSKRRDSSELILVMLPSERGTQALKDLR
ncbi:hypothetical protein BASA81_016900, partial [Batrachochytrium salamandrivorans]